ncbi:glycosyltransferase family 2 protein [Bradyrhizobium erythrophlei]|uniref:Glycosyltransferase, GT2 family n=1 Tax=Bradyrhizobium erythrophlei TaxID=1437360 RepID=A0A1H5FH81_9BRAD|nr:glycosyltransferase [Bradyrhizobium erythrophlei]SEE02790.1 Glycosyltransferase, GT2 family [Bradyrhizobium erythrophlei]
MSTELAVADRAWVTISPALDCSIETVICIPSFRRPKHLRLTLESIVAQCTERSFAVVVVENDASRCESAPVAAAFLNSGKLSGVCIVEPRQGNCQAINAAFETALETFPNAQYFLMIDDDEVASPDWLERMVQAAETSGAEIVGGPVWPNFDDKHKGSLKRHPAFAPAYHASGPVPVIYGCGNCLIRRAVFDKLGRPAFDLRFNFLGGGDHDFFARARRAGFRFFWVTDAVISETVPSTRTNLGWIVRRGLRIGAINYHIERKAAQTMWSRAAVKAKMFGLVPFSLYRFTRIVLREQQAVIAMHPMVVAVGSALAVLGIEPRPYAASKIAS